MPLGDRLPWHHRHHHHRRLVRSGDAFTSDELERGEAELELPEPSGPEPDTDDQVEPWAWGDKPVPEGVAERLRLYREFCEAREGGA